MADSYPSVRHQSTLQDNGCELVHLAMCLFIFPAFAAYSLCLPTEGWLRLSRPGSALRWFARPKTVTHPGINRVRRKATTLIETNALPLSQTGNQYTVFEPRRGTQQTIIFIR